MNVKLVPKGEYPHPSDVVQVIDDEAVRAMAANFPAEGILVDFDHYSDLTAAQRKAVDEAGVRLPSSAAGWIKRVWGKPDGLWGDLEPTPEGAKAIASLSYRYRSPVFPRRGLVDLGGGRARPGILGKVGLTNDPNMRGLPALANAARDDSVSGPAVENAANVVPIETPAEKPPQHEKEHTMDYKTILLTALGLPADATDEQIEQAVAAKQSADEALANEKRDAEDEKKRLEDENKGLENRVASLEQAALKTKVDAALKEHEPVITNRADVEAQLTRDFDGTLKVLKGIKALPNRADGDTPGDTAAGEEKLTGLAKVKAAFKK